MAIHSMFPRFLMLVCLLPLIYGGCGSPPATNAPSDEADTPTLEVTAGHEVTPAVALAEQEKSVATQGLSAEFDPTAVVLGDGNLTRGIPGDGPLTLAQAEAWLATPVNHQTLQVSLPMGLAAAGSQFPGVEANPLTLAKIELGRQLYFDKRLSADNSVSCADCHHPDEGFAKHTQFGVGIRSQTGNRNSPVSYNRILSAPQFWDGRAASLEEQAVGPIANPIEMGNTHEMAVKTIAANPVYQAQFARVFPGEGTTIENIGKAIATFERTIVTGPAMYDYNEVVRNIESQYDAEDIADMKQDDPETFQKYQMAKDATKGMSDSAKRGRDLFFSERGGCTACHAGANFTDEQFHNLGVGMQAADPDVGRYTVTKLEKDRGAFKTPTVRNVVYSAPYMHDGSQKTLEEVVDWYNQGGHPNPQLSDKVKKLNLTAQEKTDLVAFMKEGLTSSFPKIETERLPSAQ
ncbi:MAG: c-type cytochrome [Planctomycetota bacterium]|nr:c-type cytochrome [Planctomycetota bacterium]MDA1178561.1 c-type cytochrome [Planctomycetota bacterium]